MVITGLKYNLFIILLSIVFVIIDILLMICYGFEAQLLIFLYVMIGVVPLCGIISICVGMSPSVSIKNKTIRTFSIPDDRYQITRAIHNTTTDIYTDEIISCEIEGYKLIFKLRYGHIKTLYLKLFTKRQIEKIKKEIDNIIK